MILQGKIIWPYLFSRRPANPDLNNEPKYECSLLIPKDDPQIVEVKELVASLIKEKLGGNTPELLCIRDCDEPDKKGKTYEHSLGHYQITMRSNNKPGVVDQNVEEVLDPNLIRGGDIVKLSCNFYAFTKGRSGIACGLNNVQFVAKGDPIGGGATRPEDDFTPIAGGSSATPTADGGSPF